MFLSTVVMRTCRCVNCSRKLLVKPHKFLFFHLFVLMAVALFSCVINHSPKGCGVITYSAAHFLFTDISFRSCKRVERRPENVDLNSPI